MLLGYIEFWGCGNKCSGEISLPKADWGTWTQLSQGDTFLRSAYVVYDLDNQEISLGNTLFNVTDSTIREIGTGKSAVPDATGAASAVTAALASGTDTNRGNSPPVITGAVTGSPPSSPTGTKNTAPSLYPSFISILLLFTTLFISLVL